MAVLNVMPSLGRDAAKTLVEKTSRTEPFGNYI